VIFIIKASFSWTRENESVVSFRMFQQKNVSHVNVREKQIKFE
jgi:hypothetical protein